MKHRVVLFCILMSTVLSYVHAMKEKPIVVIIPSYNNKQWYKKNLDSIVNQNYSNYKVVYINDCSTDGTGDLVQEYLQKHDTEHRVTLINNTTRRGALSNLYHTIHACDDHDIILTLDGDDWFPGDHVLARVNQAYQDENIWLTYGQFKTYPENKMGFCRAVPDGVVRRGLLRGYPWITSHLRTFYAGLFKHVLLKDFLHEGSFFEVTWDIAFMYPMLEMAAGHFVFIPDVLYVYNEDNALNDYKHKLAKQFHYKHYIAGKKPYSPIRYYSSTKQSQNNAVTAVIFSDNTPERLSDCLDNLAIYARGISTAYVLYQADTQEKCCAYKKLSNRYKGITFYECKEYSIKNRVTDILQSSSSSHVLLTNDGIRMHTECNLTTCAHMMHQTKAYGFYGALGIDINQKKPPKTRVFDHYLAWQFKDGSYAFKRPFSTEFAMYARSILLHALNQIVDFDMRALIDMLDDIQFDYEHVGVCLEYAVVDVEQ